MADDGKASSKDQGAWLWDGYEKIGVWEDGCQCFPYVENSLGMLTPNRENGNGCTSLHGALLDRDLHKVEASLSAGASPHVGLEGQPPLHVACAMGAFPKGGPDFAAGAVAALLDAGALINQKDTQGNTPLHVAAQLGLISTMNVLLSAKGCLLMAKNHNDESPLHLAAGAGREAAVAALAALPRLAAAGGLDARDFLGRAPLHAALAGGHLAAAVALLEVGADPGVRDAAGTAAEDLLPAVEALAAAAAAAGAGAAAAAGRTALVFAPACERHPGAGRRLKALYHPRHGALHTQDFAGAEWVRCAAPAPLADLLRVHEYAHVARALTAGRPGGGAPPPGQCAHSAAASAAACGAACAAVDRVVAGRSANAFVVAAPASHLAGDSGPADLGATGGGAFNAVAVAAAYARHVHRNTIRRVAIVDFDALPASGTEETLWNLLPSYQECPPDLDLQGGIFKYKPWLDEEDVENVLLVSSQVLPDEEPDGDEEAAGGAPHPPASPRHARGRQSRLVSRDGSAVSGLTGGAGGGAGGGGGGGGGPAAAAAGGEGGDAALPGPGEAKVLNLDLAPLGASPYGHARLQFRQAYRQGVLPRLAAFRPDLLLLSAGFGAHEGDGEGGGGTGALLEEDFAWLAGQLCAVARACGHGRVVSVLEGGRQAEGWSASALARSAAAHARALLQAARLGPPPTPTPTPQGGGGAAGGGGDPWAWDAGRAAAAGAAEEAAFTARWRHRAAQRLQAAARGFGPRWRWPVLRRGALLLQAAGRGRAARRRYRRLLGRLARAQALARGWLWRRRWRGVLARARAAAVVLQKYWRRALARHHCYWKQAACLVDFDYDIRCKQLLVANRVELHHIFQAYMDKPLKAVPREGAHLFAVHFGLVPHVVSRRRLDATVDELVDLLRYDPAFRGVEIPRGMAPLNYLGFLKLLLAVAKRAHAVAKRPALTVAHQLSDIFGLMDGSGGRQKMGGRLARNSFSLGNMVYLSNATKLPSAEVARAFDLAQWHFDTHVKSGRAASASPRGAGAAAAAAAGPLRRSNSQGGGGSPSPRLPRQGGGGGGSGRPSPRSSQGAPSPRSPAARGGPGGGGGGARGAVAPSRRGLASPADSPGLADEQESHTSGQRPVASTNASDEGDFAFDKLEEKTKESTTQIDHQSAKIIGKRASLSANMPKPPSPLARASSPSRLPMPPTAGAAATRPASSKAGGASPPLRRRPSPSPRSGSAGGAAIATARAQSPPTRHSQPTRIPSPARERGSQGSPRISSLQR